MTMTPIATKTRHVGPTKITTTKRNIQKQQKVMCSRRRNKNGNQDGSISDVGAVYDLTGDR